MYLLDINYDPENKKISKWIKHTNQTSQIRETFYPKIFVSGSIDFNGIQSIIESFPYVKDVYIDEKKIWPRQGIKKVICVEIEQKEIYNFASMFKKIGCDICNVDINPVRQYLLNKNLFPMAKIKSYLVLDDDQNATSYNIPDLKYRNLSISPKKEKGIVNPEVPIGKITFGDTIFDKGSESELIEKFYLNYTYEDPDMIFTENGDNFELPYLEYRASKYDINLQLGRNKTIKDRMNGNSYYSYGKIYYKPRKYILFGRLHIDMSTFMFKEGGLNGLIDISRITGIPLQECSRLSPGSAITALQVNYALKNNIIIPWKRYNAEYWKTAEELLKADRGALVLEPKVGIHENVYELDFSSMFPNIMTKHNISPETVLCDCCPDSSKRVPFIGYNICEKHIGLVPMVLKPLIERRMEYKRRKKLDINKLDKLRSQEYENKQNILKWLLVTSFGYMGFNKAIFGRIESHESINAYARDILLRTMELADENGYDILHGIVDCLWVKPKEQLKLSNPEKLCNIVSDEIGINLELKGKFNWIVFLPNKTNMKGSINAALGDINDTGINATGSTNRYYGVMDNGELKIRGIEMRRRDSPLIIKNLQNDILMKLAEAKNISEFYLKIPESIKILKEYVNRIYFNAINYEDLIFQINISKEYDSYVQFNNQVAALKQLKNEGVELKKGQSVRYIITDSKTKDYKKRVILPEFADNNTKYDVNKYYQYLLKGAESILLPFGYTEKRLADIINGKIQTRLCKYII